MSENNNIDDLFKKGLSDFQQEPSENLWLKVEKGLWLKKLLRSGFNIFIGAGIITIIVLVTVTQMNKNEEKETPTTTPQNQTTITQNTKIIDSKNVINTEKPALNAINTDKSVEQFNSEKSAVKNNSTTAQNSSTATTPSNVKTNKSYTANTKNNNSSVVKKESQKPEISEKEVVQKSVQDNTLNQTQPLTEKQKEDLISRIKKDEQVIGEKISQAIQTNKTETNQPLTNDSKNTALGEALKTPSEKDNTQSGEVKTKADDIATPVIEEKNTSAEQKAQIPPVNKPKTRLMTAYEVLFYAMPSYTGKTLSGATQEEIDFRKNNEKAHLFLNYGMEFRVRIKNFTVQSGVISSQAGEKNNYDFQYLKNIDTSGSFYDMQISTHIDPQNSNNTIITFDSTWVSISDSSFANMKLNNINQIKYLEIPLNIGYVFNINSHQLGVSGGISYALLTQAAVSVLNKATNEVISISKENNILKNALWSYNVALSYSYALSGNTSLFVQSGFKKNINSIYSNSSTKQQYHFIDTKIGVMFKL